MRVWMSACIHGFLVYVHNSPVCFRCQVSCVLPLADAFPHAKGVQTFRGLVRSHEFRQERASEAFSSSCTLGVQGKDQVCQLLDEARTSAGSLKQVVNTNIRIEKGK